MNATSEKQSGFSLIELMVAVAIIAILGAVALFGYQEYTTRAAAADIVSAHHNIRTSVLAQGDKFVESCAELASGYDRKALTDPYATLDYGFEAVTGGGFRPVLTVCATAGGPGNVAVAKRAYERFSALGLAEKSPTPSDTLASFAVRLTDGEKALCKTAPVSRGGCGQAVLTQPQAVPSLPSTPAPALVPASGTVAPPTPQEIRVPRLDPAALAAALQALPTMQALPPGDRQSVTDAAKDMAASPDYAQAVQDAISQAKPGQAVGIPASAQAMQDFTTRCPANKLGPPWPTADNYAGGRCDASMSAMCGQCVVATVCPVSCGLTRGITPDAQKALDASWRETSRQMCEARYGAGDARCAGSAR